MARAAAGDDATISAVNYSEVLQKAARVGIAAEEIDAALDELAISITPFGRLDARLAASFYQHRSDLSLADRVCLALGRSLSSVTYTADRYWLNGRTTSMCSWSSSADAEDSGLVRPRRAWPTPLGRQDLQSSSGTAADSGTGRRPRGRPRTAERPEVRREAG